MAKWWFRRAAADDVADLLDRCLTRIERGEDTVESCLVAQPEQAERLRPLLLTALATRSVAAAGPSAAARARMRARVLAATAPRPMPARRRPIWQPIATAGLALAFLAVLAAPLTALQSGDAVPGDWDYGLKRAGERVRLAVTVDDGNRRDVHLALAERREREIQALLQQNRTAYIPDAVRALNVELGSIADSLGREKAISTEEARRIAEITARQEDVLKQVVEQAPQPVASIAQEARGTARTTSDAARQAAERRDTRPAPTATPASAAAARTQTSPEPSSAPRSTESPAPSASPSSSPSASPSASPTATPSASPSASPTPSPSVTPAPTPAAIQTPPATAPGIAGTPIPPLQTPPPATPIPTPTPAPTPAPVRAPQVTLPVLPTPGAIAAPTPAPVRTPAPTLAPAPVVVATPTPSPTPAPTPPSRSSTTVARPGVTLVPGFVGNFVYTGATQPLLSLLAPAAGKYEYVSYRAPNGQAVTYRPGQPGGERFIVPTGSEVTIIVTDAVRLDW